MRADKRGCVRLTWRMSRDPAWRSWTLRSYGVVGASEPFGEAGRGFLAAQKGLGSDTAMSSTMERGSHRQARFFPYGNEAQCCPQHKPLSKGGPGDDP